MRGINKLPHVAGFRFSGVAAGIKTHGGLDLGLIHAEHPATAAAVFTRNRVKAAPVRIAAQHVRLGRAQAILVNSGNANACTGKPGHDAALRVTAAAARQLGIGSRLLLPASTGVIGQLLPAEAIEAALPALVEDLAADGAERFARAIMTTDRFPKWASAKLRTAGAQGTLLGIAKGAGMIHPDMATTLAFVVTDLAVEPAFLQRALVEATENTFNRVSVDGDTSTNDSLMVLASGARANRPIGARGTDRDGFQRALMRVLGQLAEMLVADGEGTEHVVELEVVGLRDDKAALQVVRSVATSPLVKTALFGKDPNWGRILAAAGRAGVAFDPDRAEIRIGDVRVVRGGVAVGKTAEVSAHKVMRKPRYKIRLILGSGRGKASYLACDLGHTYIRINADYRS